MTGTPLTDAPMSDGFPPAVTRTCIVACARSWIGTPYHHQASMQGIGTDCLGLVRGVYRTLYGAEAAAVPGYSSDWAEASGRETMWDAARLHLIETSVAQALPGDMLLFRWRPRAVAKHVGILSAPQHLVHACEGVAVCEITMTPWWWRHAVAAFRFPGVAD